MWCFLNQVIKVVVATNSISLTAHAYTCWI